MAPHTIIIAEAGVNHNGDIRKAMKLIDAAADAGADYVKFQTFNTDALVSKNAALAEYQKKNLHDKETSQYAMLKALELTDNDHFLLKEYAESKGIKFCSTPFDLDSIEFLASMNLDFWKIPSGEITNFPFLRNIAKHGGKAIMSTGMCDMHDIGAAIRVLEKHGMNHDDIILMHCNTEYPTPMQDVNLSAMKTLERRFNVAVGYSDHTVGYEVPIAAVALGARCIEKHITLDKTLPGPDQKASLEPQDLKKMVTAIRNIEKAIGSGEKRVTESERKNIAVARKSITAKRAIKKGETFTEQNLCAKRPGTGISPMKWEEVIGTKATRDYEEDEMI